MLASEKLYVEGDTYKQGVHDIPSDHIYSIQILFQSLDY